MRIELLYFDGCPSWQTGLENLRAALAEAGIDAPVELVRVDSDEEALRQRFQGSPTIRVDGRDLFPTGHDNYAMGCRVYQTPEGLRGWPTVEMIRAALAGG
ncbi:MAG: hypothetical protein Kow00124_16580 [Anaerolineae bacterium]